MFAKERQDAIYRLLQQEGAVTTNTLIERFEVSIETVRRDLLQMERQGLLSRVHGGAVAVNGMKPFNGLTQRNQEQSEQKRQLAYKAADLVCEGDIIGIDSGSTAVCLAEVLREQRKAFTVVTHSTDVFEILKEQDGVQVILCGGHYLKKENAFYGPLTLQLLDGLHINKVFIAPSAVSLENGICDYQMELFQVQQKLLQCAEEVIVIADSTKFEKKALLKLADMKAEYRYVTDNLLAEELRRIYTENQINIL